MWNAMAVPGVVYALGWIVATVIFSKVFDNWRRTAVFLLIAITLVVAEICILYQLADYSVWWSIGGFIVAVVVMILSLSSGEDDEDNDGDGYGEPEFLQDDKIVLWKTGLGASVLWIIGFAIQFLVRLVGYFAT